MKILVALFLSVLSVGAYANDSESGGSLVQAVKARLTCEDMSARLKELTALEDPQDYDLEEIEQLKADYRRSCVKISKKRRSSVAKNQPVVADVTTDVVADSAEVAEEPVKEEITTVTETETEVVVSEADLVTQELENLDAGLCNDGSKPNQFGCCSGEVYKDLGDFVYACCPKTGGDCFPPIR